MAASARVCFDITAGTTAPPDKGSRSLSRPSTPDPRLSGAALPFVLILLALNVIVVVAMLAYATTEYQASRNSVQAESARSLAQSGIDLAAGLISANSTNNAFVTYQRVPQVGPDYRLETKIGNVVATDSAQPWKTAVTNPVVLHSGFTTSTNGFDLNYAADTNNTAGYIAPRTNLTGWQNLSPDMFRMDWIYVYKNNNTDPTNLIGRIAYWVDDESTKLNINYSGITNFYSTSSDYSWGAGYSQFSIEHAGLPKQQNMYGEKWPIQMEFGGIGGISTTNAFYIIDSRGRAKTNNFRPYPSVLAARIGTINKPGGIAITNLEQQSAFGFSATIYSREEERSYSSGQKRYNLLNLYDGAPETSTLAGFQAAITNNTDLATFASKYDLPGFASAIYTRVQRPGSESGTIPASRFGATKMYHGGLPLLNEISIKAVITNASGTNSGSLTTDVELIILSKSAASGDQYSWATSITNASAYTNVIVFSTNVIFGSPIASQTNSASSSSWFMTNAISGSQGPTNKDFTRAIQLISSTSSILANTQALSWTFPTNITIVLNYNGKSYQSNNITIPTNTPLPLLTNQVNTYHVVLQPRGGAAYRGDPRFGEFQSWVAILTNTNNSNLTPSLGFLNTNSVNSVDPPNWKMDEFGTATNTPDLVESSLYFGPDRGIPQYTGDRDQGFGGGLAGLGWIGEVPITTLSAPFLSWSTPRLWGDGRSVINAAPYPPDWLLLDCFHMAAYAAEPTNIAISNRTFSSYGRVNVNGAKTFFQIATNSKTKSDTIIDSVTVKAQTIDFREYHNNNTNSPDYSPITNLPSRNIPFGGDATNATSHRGLFLSRSQQMIFDRNSNNSPYTTHFEFLADLAATSLTNATVTNNPDWWVAPNTNTGSIYTATNTTDRRIEGIVRSLVQKLTTHGNQFTIFSVGQALQVTGTGASAKTNVVGEAYLQAVYERGPQYDETTGAITNGSANGAPPMRQLFLRELR